jgi:hypothetical protein
MGGIEGGAVLSDGTLVFLDGPAGLDALVSTDGGQHITLTPILPPGGRYQASMDADMSDGPFRDRIYVAWPMVHDGRHQVFVTYSADKGRTWFVPRIVNDDRKRLPANSGPDDMLPTIAVNRDGVVGVSWYDRRDNPNNLDYYVRFSASLDGGETWLPSVRVSERPNVVTNHMNARTPIGLIAYQWPGDTASSALAITMVHETWLESGHYAGLAASADGVFHALWVDNRTGVKQLWTAPIRVRGSARPDPALVGMHDITRAVSLTFDALRYQRTGPTTGVIVGDVYVTNTSTDLVRGPLRLQVLQLALAPLRLEAMELTLANRSAAARVVLDGGHRNWASAQAWDLSGGLHGDLLPPGATSARVPIRFRLEDLVVEPRQERHDLEGIQALPSLDLRVRVLAGHSRAP